MQSVSAPLCEVRVEGADLTIASDMRRLAEHILDSKAAGFDPLTFQDRLKAKQAGTVQERKQALAAPHRVINSHGGAALPLRVVAFDTAEGWARDVTAEVAHA
jgi:hypothetical protein